MYMTDQHIRSALQEKIRTDVTSAMKAKAEPRLTVLRGVLASITNELVSKGRTPRDKLTDEEVLTLLRRLVKQRKDSIEQYSKAHREDLADAETEEIKVLETYLPSLMSKDDIRLVVMKKKEELAVTDKAQVGLLMGSVMRELAGKADGNDVKDVVTSLFG